jgi:hypothetical protein
MPLKDVDPSVSGAFVRVEFIIGTDLIIFSPAINSNRGLLAVAASQVETPGPPKVDPSMPAPFGGGRGSGMQQRDAFAPGAVGIGSAVRIVKGVHKGKDGVVRKMMGNKLSVQVRGGQQVEVTSDMIKAENPNSSGAISDSAFLQFTVIHCFTVIYSLVTQAPLALLVRSRRRRSRRPASARLPCHILPDCHFPRLLLLLPPQPKADGARQPAVLMAQVASHPLVSAPRAHLSRGRRRRFPAAVCRVQRGPARAPRPILQVCKHDIF